MENTPTSQERRLAERDARREAQRIAALPLVLVEQPKPKHWITVLIGASATAIWLGLASWSYTAGTTGDMIGAAIILAIAFFIAMGALLASERYEGLEKKRRLAINLSVAAALALASVALFWWEHHHQPLPSANADDIANKVLEKLPSGTSLSPPQKQYPQIDVEGLTMDSKGDTLTLHGCFDQKYRDLHLKSREGKGLAEECKN